MAISNSVTSIGNASFGNCNSLTSVTIPDSVTSIGNSAFAYCETLENVTIPDSVISIGKQAFLECGIKTITIPGSVTDIGTQAFAYCSQLAEISVSTDNPVYCSADGVLFDKDKTELLCYSAGKESFSCSYEVPDGVTKIGDCSFQVCRILEEVILPDGITSIGAAAFNYCSITRMTLPDGVISIGNGAFEACGELTSITIPDSVTFIDDYAFDGCFSLTDVYYGGSEAEWNAIYIGINNDCLIYDATIHYNSTGAGSTGDTGDTGDTEATVSETLAAISETATETEIKTAVQAIAADELAAELSADTGDTGVTAQLAALEEQAGVTTSVTVADALAGSFDSSAVTVTGGALNTTTGDAVLTLAAAESADGSAYNNALAFSLTLTGDGVDSHALTVPVKITLPVPATHDPEMLVLLHYADGENPVELETTVFESGTQWYVSFVLTSFSDFVMYDSSEVETSTPGDLNGDGEVNASDLTILARHVGKVEYITDETALANADVTGDGNVDASDLTKLAQYVGKIISSLD
ncbi:MAG: leucine-rich repeat protein [Oscillospiraceae bacterium]|nr:leucine-rich repeat protein [Oscillospiraceae bacterium]